MHASHDYDMGYTDAVQGLPCCPADDADTFLYRSGYRDGLAEWTQQQQMTLTSLTARLLPSARQNVAVAS